MNKVQEINYKIRYTERQGKKKNTCYFTTEEKTLEKSEKNKLEDNGHTHNITSSSTSKHH